jgi:hypothetical protein
MHSFTVHGAVATCGGLEVIYSYFDEGKDDFRWFVLNVDEQHAIEYDAEYIDETYGGIDLSPCEFPIN